jgi:hypothetical protein
VDNDISSAKKELQAKQALRELSCGGLIHDWSPLCGFLLYCMRGNRNCNSNNRNSNDHNSNKNSASAPATATTTFPAAATTTTTTASAAAAAAKAATAATATVASPGSLQWILLDALGRGHLAP